MRRPSRQFGCWQVRLHVGYLLNSLGWKMKRQPPNRWDENHKMETFNSTRRFRKLHLMREHKYPIEPALHSVSVVILQASQLLISYQPGSCIIVHMTEEIEQDERLRHQTQRAFAWRTSVPAQALIYLATKLTSLSELLLPWIYIWHCILSYRCETLSWCHMSYTWTCNDVGVDNCRYLHKQKKNWLLPLVKRICANSRYNCAKTGKDEHET